MKNNKVSVITLGCSKNTVESEAVIGLFLKEGYEITGNLSQANIIVIHTCSFIQDAQAESHYQIQQAGLLKQQNKDLKIFVSGCLAQLLQDKMQKDYPFIDGYVGTGNFDQIVKLIKKHKFFANTNCAGGINTFKTRVLSTNSPSTYIKIAEGCNHRCSYCIIPNLRGKFISRTIKSVTDEAKALADSGIRELNVIAQDTTSYGIDIYGKLSLAKLLKEISKIKQLKWIRLLYAYPSTITKELLETIYETENICNYIDIPIQHISKKVLNDMKRPENTRKIIEKIKKDFPEITLRTSLITGFPNETEADFKELLSFVKQNYFEHVGIFGYSDQKLAKSYKLKNKISQQITEKRVQLLANAQFENVIKNNKEKIGKTFEVLPETISKDKIYCRAYFQAPEIDNTIIVNKNKNITLNKFTEITIKDYKDYDLIAK
ncbi:30S ribosomal protein S12 methylthiotransferase RimO [Candidatus Ruminimicrobiellum ovillum]|uniref:30S ribosomal protein S12 methylthiotransferase RimO n=1 Tax=Candidatus Ruminimicrobiellum ovillum TaxID=1947927 RepID=UPI003559A5EB